LVAVTGWRVLVPVVVGGLGVLWSRRRQTRSRRAVGTRAVMKLAGNGCQHP
jgi:hypothetical protein